MKNLNIVNIEDTDLNGCEKCGQYIITQDYKEEFINAFTYNPERKYQAICMYKKRGEKLPYQFDKAVTRFKGGSLNLNCPKRTEAVIEEAADEMLSHIFL